MNDKKISIIVPVYNEEGILKDLASKLRLITKDLSYTFEFIFVNDGSDDGSLRILLDLAKTDDRIKIIDLSRNFGHQIAISAGIDYVQSDAVILMDADMEDRPEDLPKILKKWQEGYEVVYVIRKSRKVSFLKNIFFRGFHFLNKMLSETPVEPAGIFGLMDKKVVQEVKRLREQNRYLPGLRSWVGFNQAGVVLERGKRYDKNPRVSYAKLTHLALNSYFSFSKKPLRLATFLGLFLSGVSFISVIFIIIFQLVIKFKVSGWASIVTIILFISGMQFICLGIIGEYIGRIFDEAKARPLYIVKNIYGFRGKG